MAKCFCHELEHLDGEIFLDKAVSVFCWDVQPGLRCFPVGFICHFMLLRLF